MSFDWNNDGKHDWKDDSIFHNVIDTDNNSDYNSSSGGFGCSTVFILLIGGYLILKVLAAIFY